MLIGRVAGLVLPLSPQFLIDDVIGRGRTELLWPLAGVIAGATCSGAHVVRSRRWSASRQRAIAEMRRTCAHLRGCRSGTRQYADGADHAVMRTPRACATGGDGGAAARGGIVTALLDGSPLLHALAADVFTLVVLGAFAGMMAYAFKRLRPIFRERNKIESEVTGRLGESLGGIRTVKVYTAEGRERSGLLAACTGCCANIASTITGTSRSRARR